MTDVMVSTQVWLSDDVRLSLLSIFMCIHLIRGDGVYLKDIISLEGLIPIRSAALLDNKRM